MSNYPEPTRINPTVSRRAFVQGSALVLGGLGGMCRLHAAEPGRDAKFQFGIVTDIHHGDKPMRINRYYRDSRQKLARAVDAFNQSDLAFVAQLGDLIDTTHSTAGDIEQLKTIEKVMSRCRAPRHYVLGNHCVEQLTKDEFMQHTPMRSPHEAVDHGGVRVISLDACYRSDGAPYQRGNAKWDDANVPPSQLEWLASQLAKSPGPVIVLAHQRLDEHGKHSTRNASQVRHVLEQAGNVAAVFQGHSHKNDYQQIAGIHYCTLVALVEGPAPKNNGYGIVSVYDDSTLRVHGFVNQIDRVMKPLTG
ncbi:alkaline phosphatase [Planctomycetales bacterium ZRK34]|nr:alkaline phosphatase [Planctomycetales bacterium ZRK34]